MKPLVGSTEPESEGRAFKFGHFAQESWGDYDLCLRKMETIKTDLEEGRLLDSLRAILANRLEVLAISKDELTPARVEPFKINLINPEPSFEKPLRYNPTLT